MSGGGSFTINELGQFVVKRRFVELSSDYVLSNQMPGSSFGMLALHELGHMVGLDHVDDVAEVMYPMLVPHTGYGNGDQEGLWWVGAPQGCLTGGLTPAAAVAPDAPEWTVAVEDHAERPAPALD